MYRTDTSFVDSIPYDAGLRRHMLRVYNLMSSGLALSAAVAMAVAYTGLRSLFYAVSPDGTIGMTGLGMVCMFAPIGMLLLAVPGKSARWGLGVTAAFYWIFVALEGIGLSSALMSYSAGDIVRAAVATAIGFGGLSIWGYSTNRDLSAIGSFCVMGLFGLIGVAVLALFTGFHVNSIVFGLIGVVVFSGLTAYDTQKIKVLYIQNRDTPTQMSYWAAITLYLDVINLFFMLLSLFGGNSQRR